MAVRDVPGPLPVSIIELSGQLVKGKEGAFREIADELVLRRNRIFLILNLKECEFLDSAGLGGVLYLRQMLTKCGGKLRFLHVSIRNQAMLRIIKLKDDGEFYSDEKTAIESFGSDTRGQLL